MISPKCLFGHDWEETTTDVSTDREEVEERKTVRKCTKCGKEEELKSETQVSISAAEQAYEDESNPVRTDGGDNDDDSIEMGAPFETVDEEQMEDDAIIIDGDGSSDSEMGSSMGSEDESDNSEEQNEIDDELDDDTILTPSGDSSGSDESSSTGTSKSGNTQSADKNDDAEIIEAGSSDVSETGSDTSNSSSNSSRETTLPEQSVSEPNTLTLVCERCSYQTTTNEGTLRGGDVCPNCSVGFLDER